MFDSLFGAEMPLAVRFFLAFLIVLGLIGGAAWAVRRFGTGRLGGASARGRQPRLAVIDYASVDGRRRLILVRRDNVEHLLMIGGPTDVVVEPNIVRAVAAPRDLPATRVPAGLDALPRAIPLPENGTSGWPLQPEPAAGPRPSPRLESLPDELPSRPFQPQAETPPRPQRDTLAALADELSTRPAAPRNRAPNVTRPHPAEPRLESRQEVDPPVEPQSEPPQGEVEPTFEPRSEPRIDPRPEPRNSPPAPFAAAPIAPPATAEAASAADQSLADMAQRLEAALRKSTPTADARPPAMPQRPVPASERIQPTNAAPPPPRAPRPSEPRTELRTARPDAKPNQGKTTLYDNLEQEMASLLGRPPKT
jgi:flagellar protein FliO/FliZ